MQKSFKTSREKREVAFTGVLIAETSDRLAMFPQDDRTINIELYAVDSGGFAAVVTLRSAAADTPFFVEAELLESEVDVEHFLYLFEPEEVIDFKNERDPQSHKKFVAVYERLAFDVLNTLTDYLAQHPDAGIVRKPEPKKPGLLQRLTRFGHDAANAGDV